jgi:peroxiredoxin Q/BCP
MTPGQGREGPPPEGELAPDFTVTTDTGTQLSLHDLRGKKVVLYFYPKDDTPGCTTEACQLRDAFPRFEAMDAVILGVSPDDVASHQRFKTKFQLPFTLLADVDHAIASAYGAWNEKSLYGKLLWGTSRMTFLIDRAGRVAKVYPKVKADGHAAEIAEVVQTLK